MIYRFLFLLSITMGYTACQSDSTATTESDTNVKTYSGSAPKVAFVCEQISFDEALPESALYITVNDSKVKLTNIPVCETYSKTDYEKYDIPTNALTAAGGYFAGLGEYFYAIMDNGKVNVMSGYLDEMQEDDGFHYDQMATFMDGRVMFKGMETKLDLTGLYALGGHDASYLFFLGMKSDTLTAQFSEIDGMLPPENEMTKYLPSFNLKPIDFAVDMNNMSFTSSIGSGKFVRSPQEVMVTFNERENLMTQEPLTLTKMK